MAHNDAMTPIMATILFPSKGLEKSIKVTLYAMSATAHTTNIIAKVLFITIPDYRKNTLFFTD